MLSYFLLTHKLSRPPPKDRTPILTLRKPLLSSTKPGASCIHPPVFSSVSEASVSKNAQFTTFKKLLFQWIRHLLLILSPAPTKTGVHHFKTSQKVCKHLLVCLIQHHKHLNMFRRYSVNSFAPCWLLLEIWSKKHNSK